MRAAVMNTWSLRVDQIADPVPLEGQVLVRVLACGICGSDLHMLRHGAELRSMMDELDSSPDAPPPDPLRPKVFDPSMDTVMGHEFCCEVVEPGPGVTGLRAGDVVVSMPVAFDASGLHSIGYSNAYPGGYGELMVLNELLAIKVPSDLPPRLAALTEPLAVGVHAVAKSRIVPGEAAVVLGLGPVGLACVAELRMRGIGPIVGTDLSPRRRQLAESLGCDVVVDPDERHPMDAWRDVDGQRPVVIFEAVGVPGMIHRAMTMAPRDARILVVGACMQADHIVPMVGITRELDIRFALGYRPDEFTSALTAIAEQRVDLAPMITGVVGLDDVPAAFRDLERPDQHAKLLVEP